MYSKEDALKIKAKVEKDGVFLWKKDMNTIHAREYEYYLYSNEEKRNNHIEKQKELGFVFHKDQNSKTSLYTNFFKENEDVILYTAYFEKRLEPIKWD